MTREWLDLGWAEEIPIRGSRTVQVTGGDDIALFRTGDGNVHAMLDRCPHRGGRLSQGIIHGGTVACPLHNWRISLATGKALGNDSGCVPVIPVKIDAGRVLIARTEAIAATRSAVLSSIHEAAGETMARYAKAEAHGE